MTDDTPHNISLVPPETGAATPQREATTGELLEPEPNIGSAFLAAAIDDASHAGRGFTKESGEYLVPGIVNALRADLESARRRCAELDNKLEKATNDKNIEHTRAEVLQTRLTADRKTKVISSVCITAGGLLFGLAANQPSNGHLPYISMLGLAIMLAGWIVTVWRAEK